MCAILDKNAVGHVFGDNRPEAGRKFFEWMDSGQGRLVAGGKLLQELDQNRAFRKWHFQAVIAGRLTLVPDKAVDIRARQLVRENVCRSDDEHIVAVAEISGARLLYSHDRDLQNDFRDRTLIDSPPGKVYSTDPKVSRGGMTKGNWRLLADRNLCARSDK